MEETSGNTMEETSGNTMEETSGNTMEETSGNHIYYKITNKNENHNRFQYHDGLNQLDESTEQFNSNPIMSCCPGGLYFTTLEHIHKFYCHGCHLREVTLPTDNPKFKMVKDPQNDKWRANMIILGDKYQLGNIDTIKKFNLKITPDLLSLIVRSHNIDSLQYVHNVNPDIIKSCVTDLLIHSIMCGETSMLSWFKNNGYDFYIMRDVGRFCLTAQIHDQLCVVEWLANNGYITRARAESILQCKINTQHVKLSLDTSPIKNKKFDILSNNQYVKYGIKFFSICVLSFIIYKTINNQ